MLHLQMILATSNSGKLREIAAVLGELGVDVAGLDKSLNIPEPIEDGETFGANARLKARYYAQATGQWCLADDSGLIVDALGGQPGVYSARYAAERCNPQAGREEIDQANNAKLLDELADVPDEKRTARFACHLALASGNDILLEAEGTIEGQIAHGPAGDNGFGYDPLFYVPEKGCTTAELPPAEKNSISHRGNALRIFAKKLTEYLEQNPT